MRLTELFDSPYSFINQEFTGDKALYYFKNSQGLDFRVQFLRESYGTWEVSFGNDTNDGVKVKRSGDGDEFRVFATVIEVIRDFMSKTEFDSIKFYAHREGEARTDRNIRDSRIDLYKRLLKRFATQNNLEFADQAIARMHLFQFRKKQVNEGYKLKLERDTDMMVLNITDTKTGKRTEVRGKAGYETNGYDANDKLHQLLDKISKSANISELMNGELVGINPKHPAGASAKAATTQAFNENVSALASELEQKYNLKSLFLGDMASRNAIELHSIIVNKEEQGQGTGSKVMQEIIAYADANDKIVVLDTGLLDKQHGTTSQSRLRKFYKQFGFIDNKGRNKNYEFRNLMIRYPQTNETVTEAFDNPYPYRWDTKDEDHWVAKADTPTGLMLVMFEWMDGDSSWNIDFAVNGRMGKSGKGDAFRTFATVVAVIKDWVSKVDLSKTKLISFSADKTTDVGPSRSKLYKRFAIQMAIQLGWQLDINTKDVVDDFFKIINPELVDDDEDEDVWINEDGKIVPGVNTTVDVQPGETERQAAKFNLMKSSSKGPKLLHKSAAKNSNPNTLSNLGLN